MRSIGHLAVVKIAERGVMDFPKGFISNAALDGYNIFTIPDAVRPSDNTSLRYLPLRKMEKIGLEPCSGPCKSETRYSGYLQTTFLVSDNGSNGASVSPFITRIERFFSDGGKLRWLFSAVNIGDGSFNYSNRQRTDDACVGCADPSPLGRDQVLIGRGGGVLSCIREFNVGVDQFFGIERGIVHRLQLTSHYSYLRLRGICLLAGSGGKFGDLTNRFLNVLSIRGYNKRADGSQRHHKGGDRVDNIEPRNLLPPRLFGCLLIAFGGSLFIGGNLWMRIGARQNLTLNETGWRGVAAVAT